MKSFLACARSRACRVSVGSLLFVPLVCKILLAVPNAARAEPEKIEVRNFQISVDGDRCGKCQLSIESRADGRQVVLGNSSLELKYFLYTFRFSSIGNEIWHAGKLEKLENAAHYGSSRYQVSASGKGDELVVKTDGQERKLPRDVWTTSYWHEPEDRLLGRKVALLDSHKGRSLSAKLERVGEESLTLGDKDEKCSHYRLRGDVEVDLWYDSTGRMVRQEAVESGHRTRLQLVAIE